MNWLKRDEIDRMRSEFESGFLPTRHGVGRLIDQAVAAIVPIGVALVIGLLCLIPRPNAYRTPTREEIEEELKRRFP